MTHHLAITSTFDDGHVSTWTYYDQPGSAQDAHNRLARRWKDAGHVFERDQAERVLRRRYEVDDGRGESVAYVDEIRHEDVS